MSTVAKVAEGQATDRMQRPYWIHALTPLHVGSGRGIGFIDLPIMREEVTGYPFVPGSAVKGVIADYHGADEEARDPSKNGKYRPALKLAFGAGGDDYSNSGAIVFTDARLVCLPVRSLYGTFAWCTSHLVLKRLQRDLSRCDGSWTTEPPGASEVGQVVLANQLASALTQDQRVFFEDLDFNAAPNADAARWAKLLAEAVFPDPAWHEVFEKRFAIVHDDVFSFLCETATQVDARVKIDDQTKTVADGQLWYEESLPAESILAGIAWCGPVFGTGNRNDPEKRRELVREFCSGSHYLQLGGKATVGRGQVRLTFADGGPRA
jgi:CRISPR-associated protein Cmr4